MDAIEAIWPPNRIQLTIVLLVGASGGLVSLSVGAPIVVIAIATLLGLLLGAVCTAYLTWIAPSRDVPPRRKRR